MKQKLNCILLIDDDEATNFLSNIIIEESGCALDIKTRQTAKAALKYITDSSQPGCKSGYFPYPELIFLDINMPAMDGWEFLEKYKEIKNNLPHIPIIIMLSTSINPDDKLKAMGLSEISDYYNKPITSEMIRQVVDKYFPAYV
ncbi:MAG: response regulator [Ferruginibacter sp.]|nr:response regulator [Ferruginibacter sp.]